MARSGSPDSHRCPHRLGRGYRMIGTIERLQLATGHVKSRKEGAKWTYDPTLLRAVDSLIATRWGLAGQVTDTMSTLDSHHRVRRSSDLWEMDRVVSVGFTSHYESLRREFPSLELGDAGENIIVTTSEIISFAMIAGGIHICGSGGALDLCLVQPIDPCVPFARYLGGYELDRLQVRAVMADIGGGVRGFSGRPCRAAPRDFGVGAEVWVKAGWVPVVRRDIKESVVRLVRLRAGRLIRRLSTRRVSISVNIRS